METGVTVIELFITVAVVCPVVVAAPICFEAELANRIEPPMEIHSIERCGDGRALLIRQGVGSDQSTAGPNGIAFYAVNIPVDGRYDVWLRVRWLDECSNSVYLFTPDGTRFMVTDHAFGNWHWVRGGTPRVKAGTRIFMLRNREDGVGIDQVAISPVGHTPPRGVLAPTLVPGSAKPSKDCPALDWSITAVPAGLPDNPPRRYNVRHSLGGAGDGVAYPVMTCALPGNPITLDLWLRNNTAGMINGRVRFKEIVGILLRSPQQLEMTVPAHGLSRYSFRLVPENSLPIGEHPIRFHVRTGGRLRRARARLVRPLEWQFAGPFPLAPNAGIDVPYPPETEGMYREEYRMGKKTVAWRSFPRRNTYSPFGFVNLVRLFGDACWKVCFARSRIVVRDKDSVCQLVLMGDDGTRVWVDGVCRATADASLPATLNRRIVRVSLAEGTHDIMVKCCQASNYWEFFVSFVPLVGEVPNVFGVPLSEQDWARTVPRP